jgi:hypothetical protein
MGSTGGVVVQPLLGKAADVYSYSTSLVIGGAVQLISAPFFFLSRREHAAADVATSAVVVPPTPPVAQEVGPSGS